MDGTAQTASTQEATSCGAPDAAQETAGPKQPEAQGKGTGAPPVASVPAVQTPAGAGPRLTGSTPAQSSGTGEEVSVPVDKLGTLVEKDASMIAQQFRQSYVDLMRNTRKPNVLIVGTTGAGKSSLINSVFGKRLAQEGAGVPITTHFKRYAPEDGNVVIYDSRGLEHGNTEMFINDTRNFFQSLSAENSIHVVWYVINGAGSRIQPFEEEICRTLFADIPLIFLINKADISSDEDRAILRQTLTQLNLKSCVGIFDTVSGDHAPLLNVTKCPKCGSDDLDIRKKKGIATCLACNETISLFTSTEGLIAKTLETLPVLAREAFIAAQTSSCRHKDRRAKDIIREYYEEAGTVRFAKPLLKCIARMLVRLSVLWDFRENGKTLSTEIAQDLLRREFSFRDKILLFLQQSRGERDRTTAMGIIWNRCLRKIFISIFVNTAFSGAAAPADDSADDSAEYWHATVQKCFVDMNELEQAAVEKWLAHNSLNSLLDREMTETGDTVIPPPLVPDAAASPVTATALAALLKLGGIGGIAAAAAGSGATPASSGPSTPTTFSRVASSSPSPSLPASPAPADLAPGAALPPSAAATASSSGTDSTATAAAAAPLVPTTACGTAPATRTLSRTGSPTQSTAAAVAAAAAVSVQATPLTAASVPASGAAAGTATAVTGATGAATTSISTSGAAATVVPGSTGPAAGAGGAGGVPLVAVSAQVPDARRPTCRVLIPENLLPEATLAAVAAAAAAAAAGGSASASSCSSTGTSTGTNSPSTPGPAAGGAPEGPAQASPLARAPAPAPAQAPVVVKKPFVPAEGGGGGDGPKLTEDDLAELDRVAEKESYINRIETATDLENALKRTVAVQVSPSPGPQAAAPAPAAPTATRLAPAAAAPVSVAQPLPMMKQ